MRWWSLLAAIACFAMPADAHAQIVIQYHKHTKRYSLDIEARLGSWGYGATGYGYAYGYGYGYGYGGPPITVHSPLAGHGPGYSIPDLKSWTTYSGYGLEYGHGYRPPMPACGYLRPAPWVYQPPLPGMPEGPAPPSPSRVERTATDREILEAFATWRGGDPVRALDLIKKSVGNNLNHGGAQIAMGLLLLANGDARNADKALRSGLESATDADLLALDLASAFRSTKDISKFTANFDRLGDAPGALSAGCALLLLGQPDRAAAVLGKVTDPAAKRLAALAR